MVREPCEPGPGFINVNPGWPPKDPWRQPAYPSPQCWPPQINACMHCYCQSGLIINGVPHHVCCKCGDRRAVPGQITWSAK